MLFASYTFPCALLASASFFTYASPAPQAPSMSSSRGANGLGPPSVDGQRSSLGGATSYGSNFDDNSMSSTRGSMSHTGYSPYDPSAPHYGSGRSTANNVGSFSSVDSGHGNREHANNAQSPHINYIAVFGGLAAFTALVL